ncbi:hypothetical protein Tco_0413036 [Tanacetum coccineum]
MVVRGLKGHRYPRLKFYGRHGKGTISENRLLCCVPDTAYGSCPIRCISEKSALAVEIDLTWSRGFVFVELGRLPNPLTCKTLLIVDLGLDSNKPVKSFSTSGPRICSIVPFLRVFSHLLNEYFRISSSFGRWTVFVQKLSFEDLPATESIVTKFFEKLPLQFKGGILVDRRPSESDSIRLGVSKNLIFKQSFCSGFSKDDEYAIRRLDSKTQYAVLIRRFDTSYPTGGYGVSGPHLFVLILHPLLHKIKDSCKLVLHAWYLDDGTVIGDSEEVSRVLDIIKVSGPGKKTEIFWPSCNGMKLREGLFPVNIRRPSSGVKLLGGAISGDVDFISGLPIRRAANAIDLMGLHP